MTTKFIAIVAAGLLSSAATHAAELTRSPILTFTQAKAVQEKAEQVISSHHIGGVVVIVNEDGLLITSDKLDGATLANTELAPKKAHTAVAFGLPTSVFQDRLTQGNNLILANPSVVPLGGGIPLTLDGKIVGAIGVSTPDGKVDVEAAQAAAALIDPAH